MIPHCHPDFKSTTSIGGGTGVVSLKGKGGERLQCLFTLLCVLNNDSEERNNDGVGDDSKLTFLWTSFIM